MQTSLMPPIASARKTTTTTSKTIVQKSVSPKKHIKILRNEATATPVLQSTTESGEKPKDPEKPNESTTNEHSCKVCARVFKTVQECFRHELLQHTHDRVRPQKKLRNKISAMMEVVKDNKREELHKALYQSLPGMELDVVCKFYAMNKDNFDIVYTRIQTCLHKELRGQFNIQPFGSIVSELALRDSDIDLYLDPVKKLTSDRTQLFNRVNSMLRRSVCFEDIISIRHARVPIIKCKHSESGFSLDINLSSASSVKNSLFLRDLIRWDARLHKLLLFIKVWAKQLQIVGRGNMTSYCLITLVLFYLQQRNLLKSIKELQTDCIPHLIAGINYAYNLKQQKPWPEMLTPLTLIKEFFIFYHNFNFSELMIAPYMGKAIPFAEFAEFSNFNEKYPDYEAQRAAVKDATGEEAEHFQLNRCVCVQDPFSLGHNIAKSISQPNLVHFRECVSHAVSECNNDYNGNIGALYEQLLFGKLEQLLQEPLEKESKKQKHNDQQQSQPSQQNSSTTKVRNAHTYRLQPSRAELRTLQNYFVMNKLGSEQTIYDYWSKQYINVIKELLTEIYCVDLKLKLPQQEDDEQKMDSSSNDDNGSNDEQTKHIWLMSANVDMWTGRNHQRIAGQTYLATQQEQTKLLTEQRHKNASFSVELRGVLELIVCEKRNQIDIIVWGHDHSGMDLQRNSPLTKLFATLKCALQSFRLKEKLEGC